jgi:proline iminopeptidase
VTATDVTASYQHGYLNVSDGHRLYFERYGKPGGIPVLFVHGGPGAGFGDKDKTHFDPAVFDVLLFDQRGAGRSKPFASLRANTTDHLVDDIDKLLAFVGLDRVLLFGGSWGSTLALVYAIRRPERVTAMLLRGIFLADSVSIDHFIGGGVGATFPEAWARFIECVPADRRSDPAQYYLSMMTSDDEDARERFAYEWALYELSCVKLDTTPADVAAMLDAYSYRSLAPLEAHYMAHQCFLPDDYILNGVDGIAHIPASIVHGRYDAICLARDAYRLHLGLPGSRLTFVCAGHSASEPAIADALVIELRRLAASLHA